MKKKKPSPPTNTVLTDETEATAASVFLVFDTYGERPLAPLVLFPVGGGGGWWGGEEIRR